MKFTFNPSNEKQFKKMAVGKNIETIVINSLTGQRIIRFTRSVRKLWKQTCKNNIETDHRIKAINKDTERDMYIVHTSVRL